MFYTKQVKNKNLAQASKPISFEKYIFLSDISNQFET